MDVTFDWLPVAAFIEEPNILELYQMAHDEFEFTRQMPLAVDFDRMLEADRQGRYRIWAVHKKEGLLIGFIEFYLGPTFHNKTMLYAENGGHYCHPEYRTGWLWIRMWRTAETALRGLGVDVISAHDNPVRPLNVFFKRLGYVEAGMNYGKVLR